jgi:hypothetical protein
MLQVGATGIEGEEGDPTVSVLKIIVLWDVTPCRLVEYYCRFSEACTFRSLQKIVAEGSSETSVTLNRTLFYCDDELCRLS